MNARRNRLEGRPQKPRQFPRDRDGDLGSQLLSSAKLAKPATEALLRLVGNRDHASRLSLPTPGQRDAHTRAMLVMPGDLDEQTAHQGIPGSRNAAAALLLTRR